MESKGTLTGDQYPKGVSEERVREIAREEFVNALAVLKDVVANTPQRADGSLNARDFYDSLEIAGKQLMSKPDEPAS
jgi:hypothetical protein